MNERDRDVAPFPLTQQCHALFMKSIPALLLLAALFAPCRRAEADAYLVGETHAGTQAILFLDYNTYGAGTVLFATSLTLRYKDGNVETLPLHVKQAATRTSRKADGLLHFTVAFEAYWGENEAEREGRIELAYAGPSNSQKGVPDVDRSSEVNDMHIVWKPGKGVPRRGTGEYRFKKLTLYGWHFDEGSPEGFDEDYAYSTQSDARRLLKPFIADHPDADPLFEAGGDDRMLESSYVACFDPKDGMLHVQMTWWARFGRSTQSARPADLNLAKATLEEVTGGAFRDTVALTIPAREKKTITTRRWPPNAMDEMGDGKMKTSQEDSMVIHFNGMEKAWSALEELRELASRSTP